MTIQNRELNRRLTNLQHCAEKAPAGIFDAGKKAAEAIDAAIEGVRSTLRAHGFSVDGADHCRDLEASIYGYLIYSNPGNHGLIAAEAFGEYMGTPAAERVMAQAIRDRDALQSIEKKRDGNRGHPSKWH